MKTIALCVVSFLLISPFAFAGGIKKQPSPAPPIDLHLNSIQDKPKYFNRDHQGRAISLGYVQFDSENLNGYLDSASVHDNFKNYYLGIAFDAISNNEKHLDMVSAFSFIIPQKINAGANDSLQLKLSGWHWTTSFFGYDIIGGKTVTLALAPAITWGNLKMRRTDVGQKTRYTNPFVAPGGRAEFRLTFGNFMIGARATYRYDITHDLWKRKDNLMPVLPPYKNTGLAYFGYIGLIF